VGGEIINIASVTSDVSDANPDDNSAATITTVMLSALSLVQVGGKGVVVE